MTYFLNTLTLARQSEIAVQAELEHIERLHRIARLPGRPAEYMQNIAEKLARLEKRLNKSIDLAVDRKNKALDLLDGLEGNERTVLYRYYILGESWETIAKKTFMSERNVYKLRKIAMDKLEALHEKNAMPYKRPETAKCGTEGLWE